MANDFLTVADLVADAFDLSGQEFSDLKNAAPLMSTLPVIESSDGAVHKYAKYTQEPVVGFRAENAGRDFDHSVDTIVTETLKILDFSWAVDKAVADAWRQGGAAALIAREGNRHLQSAMFTAEKQLIRGTNNSASGCNGWEDNANVNALADEMVVNAGGSTATSQTSVYLIRASEVMPVVRPEGGIELGESIVMNMTDGSSLNYPVYYTPACFWMASQIGGLYSMARIVNVETSLTDAMIADAISKFPAGRGPSHIVMNSKAQELLRSSRTATNPTGAPAPIVESAFTVPVITTDAIVSTEAVIT